MTVWAACGWSLTRSLLVALVAAPLALWLQRRLSTLANPARAIAWLLLLVPLLFPTLLSGYAYAGASLQLANAAWWRHLPGAWPAALSGWLAAHNSALDEALLDLLLVARCVPVGVLLLASAPRPDYSPAAWHCRKMSLRGPRQRAARAAAWMAYRRYGPGRAVLIAGGLMYLVAFQEFELPSLLGRPSWTVWLFDAQVGGLSLADSLRATLLPVACELGIVVPLIWKLHSRWGAPAAPPAGVPGGRAAAWRDATYLLAAALASSAVPLWLIGQGVWQGLQTVTVNRLQWERLLRESLAGVLFSLTAAAVALGLAGALQRRGVWSFAVPALALPGLVGPLVLGLGLVRLFQWGPLNPVYRTPVSLICGLSLFLLPRAWLVQRILTGARPHAALHAAALLAEGSEGRRRASARELAWQMSTRGQFWLLSLLTFWGYLELTVAYLLGPVSIVSVPVLLYNQMHFGKNAMLSSMSCVAVAVPAVLFLLAAALRPLVFRCLRQ